MTTDKQNQELLARLDAQQATIDMLMQAVPQEQLARLRQTSKDHGTVVKLWTYRENLSEEPRLIIKTELISNDVSFNPLNGAIIENQTIRLFFESSKDDAKKINILKAQIGRMKSAGTIDAEKLKEREEDLRIAELPKFIDMPYLNFQVRELGNKILKVPVKVKGTKKLNDEDFLIVDWKGEDMEISINYVN